MAYHYVSIECGHSSVTTLEVISEWGKFEEKCLGVKLGCSLEDTIDNAVTDILSNN